MYKGIIPPLVTPINEIGEVCEASVKKLMEHVHPHSSALMPTLTSGEGWKLSKKQWSSMIDYTMKYAKGLHVLAGVEFATSKEIIEYGLLAKQKNVHAIVVTAPFGRNIAQNDIYNHFYEIGRGVNITIFVYNEKSISGNAVDFETMLEICKLPQIIGVKEASGDVQYTNELIQAVDIPVFQGWESLAYSTTGPAGYIFPLANLEPKLCLDMLRKPSIELQSRIDTLCKEYEITDSAPYGNLKKNLKLRNIIESDLVIA